MSDVDRRSSFGAFCVVMELMMVGVVCKEDRLREHDDRTSQTSSTHRSKRQTIGMDQLYQASHAMRFRHITPKESGSSITFTHGATVGHASYCSDLASTGKLTSVQ